ncbi:MAG: 4Fe-4S binding protein, partial [Oscillospiraceae bacterium]|nr:4Fe-4S binding protein [Oscillospiraceae bacterium]
MDKHRKDLRAHRNRRLGIQAVSTLLHNANFKGFFTGKIYQGPLKTICVPGLNCYSCPGAVGACPIGSLQSFLGGLRFRFPYYVLGLLIFFGALLGRAVCGLLCPFGLLQELLNKIPFPKRDRHRADRPLRALKYAVLGVLVIVLPLSTELTPYYCKYLCPAGTLAGSLLALRDPLVRMQLGPLFSWKASLLVIILVACLAIWRPFCKYLCPLGAIYGFFNRVSLYRMELDPERC